jgi:hypothetical protein
VQWGRLLLEHRQIRQGPPGPPGPPGPRGPKGIYPPYESDEEEEVEPNKEPPAKRQRPTRVAARVAWETSITRRRDLTEERRERPADALYSLQALDDIARDTRRITSSMVEGLADDTFGRRTSGTPSSSSLGRLDFATFSNGGDWSPRTRNPSILPRDPRRNESPLSLLSRGQRAPLAPSRLVSSNRGGPRFESTFAIRQPRPPPPNMLHAQNFATMGPSSAGFQQNPASERALSQLRLTMERQRVQLALQEARQERQLAQQAPQQARQRARQEAQHIQDPSTAFLEEDAAMSEALESTTDRLHRAHQMSRQPREPQAHQAMQLGQLNVTREDRAFTSIQQHPVSSRSQRDPNDVSRGFDWRGSGVSHMTEAERRRQQQQHSSTNVPARRDSRAVASAFAQFRRMQIESMPGQEQQMVAHRRASDSDIAEAERRRQAQFFPSGPPQLQQEEPSAEGLLNSFSSLAISPHATPSSSTNGYPLMNEFSSLAVRRHAMPSSSTNSHPLRNSLDGFDDRDVQQNPSLARPMTWRLSQQNVPNSHQSPEVAGPSYSTNGLPLHHDNAHWDLETCSEIEDLARQSRGSRWGQKEAGPIFIVQQQVGTLKCGILSAVVSILRERPTRRLFQLPFSNPRDMRVVSRPTNLQSFLRISLLTDDISCRGDGEVTRMGAGESYRPSARPRSPTRTDSFRGDRDRDRSPRRERARTPPTDSWHPSNRDRSPRRRSRTPPRRDRSPLRDNWRSRPRSPIRGRTPPRRFSPRRDEDRRPRSPVRRDDRSVL